MIHPAGSGLGQDGSILKVGPLPWAERKAEAEQQKIRRKRVVMRAIYPHELLDSTGKDALKYGHNQTWSKYWCLLAQRGSQVGPEGQMQRVDTRVCAVLLAVLALGGGFARAQQTPAASNATAAVPAAVQVHIDHVMTSSTTRLAASGYCPPQLPTPKLPKTTPTTRTWKGASTTSFFIAATC